MKSMNYESNFYAQTILNTIHEYLQLMKSLKVIFNELCTTSKIRFSEN